MVATSPGMVRQIGQPNAPGKMMPCRRIMKIFGILLICTAGRPGALQRVTGRADIPAYTSLPGTGPGKPVAIR